jgi:predicted nucleotide-binding protein
VPQRRQSRESLPEQEPVLRVTRSQLDREIQQRLELGQQLLDRQVPTMEAVNELRRDFYTWDEFNQQLLESRFSTARVAGEYAIVAYISGGGRGTPQQELERVHSDITRQRRKLESVRQRLPLYTSEVQEDEVESSPAGSPQGKKVFVVHGHDGDVKYQVVEFLEKITGERPIVLHEQPDSGRTIIEKFEDHASDAGFAVVLLTADDLGRAKEETTLSPRARQNVVLELGFFIGRLGRSRVVALHEAGVELPSDLSGVLYKPLAGNWHTALAGELRVAGIEVDLGRLG